jgi:tetratricopeptide (TPR) repeat protein
MVASKKQLQAQAQAIISAADAGLFATTVTLADAFLKENPNSLRGWLDLGHALTCLCRYDRAIEAYQQAIELANEAGQNPDGIHSELGQLYRQRGDFESAANSFQNQIDANPDDAAGYLMKATLQLQGGQADLAMQTLTRALDCSSGVREEVHYSLGVTLRSMGELSKARDQFQQALSLSPDYSAAKNALKDVKSAVSASLG